MNENNKFQFVDEKDITEDTKKEQESNIDITKRFYFSFEARIIVSIILILILFAGACFLALKVINHTTVQKVNYVENGDVNYQVCLKNSTCVPENAKYDSSDITTIKVTFKYDAKFDKKIKNNNSYRVAYIVSKYDKDTHNLLDQKEINLIGKTSFSSYNENYSNLEVVTIDYNKYKELYNDSDNIDSQIEIVYYLEENNETRKISGLVIPLSKDSFELRKYTTINIKRGTIIKVNIWDKYSLIYGISSSLLVLISLILIYRTTRLVLKVTNNKNDYEDTIEALLKEYDNIIVVARDGYESIVEREIIKVEEFEELVKVRDRIGKPIIFSRVNNVKSEFIVEDDNILYKYVIKEADFID